MLEILIGSCCDLKFSWVRNLCYGLSAHLTAWVRDITYLSSGLSIEVLERQRVGRWSLSK